MKLKLINYSITFLLLFTVLSAGKCKKKKDPPATNNRVNISFNSKTFGTGNCPYVQSTDFNKFKVTFKVGTLDANNNVVWDETKTQVYEPNSSLSCCAHPFAVPSGGTYVVKITLVSQDCKNCCTASCNNSNGRPMYSKEFTDPKWGDGINISVDLNWDGCLCC